MSPGERPAGRAGAARAQVLPPRTCSRGQLTSALGLAAQPRRSGILGVLVWRFGTGPFIAGLARVDAGSLAVAGGVAVVTTLACAWRWTVVARGLGVALPLPTAVAAYYRSQFLNVATPGGILGDVDRALRHGRDVGDTSRGLRSVVWERVAGQVVLVAVAGSVLVLLPSPVRHTARGAGLVAAAATLALGVLLALLRWGRCRGRGACAHRHGGGR